MSLMPLFYIITGHSVDSDYFGHTLPRSFTPSAVAGSIRDAEPFPMIGYLLFGGSDLTSQLSVVEVPIKFLPFHHGLGVLRFKLSERGFPLADGAGCGTITLSKVEALFDEINLTLNLTSGVLDNEDGTGADTESAIKNHVHLRGQFGGVILIAGHYGVLDLFKCSRIRVSIDAGCCFVFVHFFSSEQALGGSFVWCELGLFPLDICNLPNHGKESRQKDKKDEVFSQSLILQGFTDHPNLEILFSPLATSSLALAGVRENHSFAESLKRGFRYVPSKTSLECPISNLTRLISIHSAMR